MVRLAEPRNSCIIFAFCATGVVQNLSITWDISSFRLSSVVSLMAHIPQMLPSQQTFRLMMRPHPRCIKYHFVCSYSQLAVPTDPSENIDFGRNLRKSSSCKSNHYVFGTIGKLFQIVREWCLFYAAILKTYCVIQV